MHLSPPAVPQGSPSADAFGVPSVAHKAALLSSLCHSAPTPEKFHLGIFGNEPKLQNPHGSMVPNYNLSETLMDPSSPVFIAENYCTAHTVQFIWLSGLLDEGVQ